MMVISSDFDIKACLLHIFYLVIMFLESYWPHLCELSVHDLILNIHIQCCLHIGLVLLRGKAFSHHIYTMRNGGIPKNNQDSVKKNNQFLQNITSEKFISSQLLLKWLCGGFFYSRTRKTVLLEWLDHIAFLQFDHLTKCIKSHQIQPENLNWSLSLSHTLLELIQ